MRVDPGGAFDWVRLPRASIEQLDSLGVSSPLLAQLMWNRGVRSATEAHQFLTPDDAPLGDPFLLRGMEPAVRRIERAITAGERIAIYGDYDADGLTAAALLCSMLMALGAQPCVFIPHRERDGYGVTDQALEKLAEEGASLVITVDCGISAIDEIARIAERGVDVIVTDHHPAVHAVPEAVAVINPNQPDCPYPFKALAGAGVAFKLAHGLADANGGTRAAAALEQSMDLVALGTTADVVPLMGENRAMVARGLARLRGPEARPGLESLARLSGMPASALTAESLAYQVVPRLNAAGRIDDARGALDLLLAQTREEADELAATLCEQNRERQERTEKFMARAREELAVRAPEGIIVLAGEYPIGIAGILAARLVDEYQLPAIVLQDDGERLRGSARGPESVDVAAALAGVTDLLERHGGHPRAAGLQLARAHFEHLRAALEERFAPGDGAGETRPKLNIDCRLRPDSVNWETARAIDRLEPHGAGNPTPLFLWREVDVLAARPFGGGHFALTLRAGERVKQSTAFRPRLPAPERGSRIDLVFELRQEYWRGTVGLSLRARDWRLREPALSER